MGEYIWTLVLLSASSVTGLSAGFLFVWLVLGREFIQVHDFNHLISLDDFLNQMFTLNQKNQILITFFLLVITDPKFHHGIMNRFSHDSSS
jgi:Na+/proline symporter